MAPALTQDSQQELLLPYLTTPPYTPSPPSSLVGSGPAAPHHINNSCINMEHGPPGVLKHQQQQQHIISSTSTNTTDHTSDNLHHHHTLKLHHDKFKLDFDSSSTSVVDSVSARPITLNQPTPPHSTDSSAPLSPLLGERTNNKLNIHSLDTTSQSNLDYIEEEFSPQSNKSPSHSSDKVSFASHLHISPCHQPPVSPPRPASCHTAANDHLLEESSFPCRPSPCKDAVTASEPAQSLPPGTGSTTTPPLPLNRPSTPPLLSPPSRKDCPTHLLGEPPPAAPSNLRHTLAPNPSDSLSSSNIGQTKVLSTVVGGAGPVISADAASAAAPLATMGCSATQVENKVPGRCSAPQPNDTPPPGVPFLPRIPSSTAMPSTTDLIDDSMFPTLPDEFFKSLNHLVSNNPELLDQLNHNNNSSSSTVLSNTLVQTCVDVPALTAQQLLGHGGVAPCAVVAPLPMTLEQQAAAQRIAAGQKQLQLQKRLALLLRRARRITARGLTSNVSAQLEVLLSQGAGQLRGGDQPNSASTVGITGATTAAASPSFSAQQQQPPRYDPAVLKSLSPTNLITYVRRMETGGGSRSIGGDGNTSTVVRRRTRREHESQSPLPCLSPSVRSELLTIAGEGAAAARLHLHHDSDATESSSGGESCDEMDGYNDDLHTHSRPIESRALYRHASERAWVASRWTWLEAQLADLECKIHQHRRGEMRLKHMGNRSSKSDLQALQQLHNQTTPSSTPVKTTTTTPTTNNNTNNNGVTNSTTTTTTTSSNSSDGTTTITTASPLLSPAHIWRPAYTCFTRTSNNINGFHNNTGSTTGSAAGGAGTTTTTSISGSSSSSGSSSGAQWQCGVEATSPGLSASEGGCARSLGYRWHRKRRWIRVGNVYERGNPHNTNVNNNKASRLEHAAAHSGASGSSWGYGDTVNQPTFGVPCHCVRPYSCILCSRLPVKGPPGVTGVTDSTVAVLSGYSELHPVKGGAQQHLASNNNKHLPSSQAIPPSPQKNLNKQWPVSSTSPALSSSSLSSPSRPLPPPTSTTKSPRLHNNNSRPVSAATTTSNIIELRVSSGGQSHALCKSAWFPRVASSSRITLNTNPRRAPLLERLGRHLPSYHPVLSHLSEVPQSIRLESILKSKKWLHKLPSLRAGSCEAGSSLSRLVGGDSASHHQLGSQHTDPLLSHGLTNGGHTGSSHSHSKKKKKSKDKDRSRDKDGKRKDKKKKGYKRKEKESKKMRLTLRLRKSSITGELVPTGDAPCTLDSAHHFSIAEGSGGEGRSQHRGRYSRRSHDREDSSSVYSSSRPSSPSLPPHSPAPATTPNMNFTSSKTFSFQHQHHLYDNKLHKNKSQGHLEARFGGCGAVASPTGSDTGHRATRGADTTVPTTTSSSRGAAGSTLPATTSCRANAGASTTTPTSSSRGLVSSTMSHKGPVTDGAPATYVTRRASMHGTVAVTLSSSTYHHAPFSTTTVSASVATNAFTSSLPSGSNNMQPLTPAAAAAMSYKNKQGTASYDIDNIVIPYNMASVTRVEHIEYKEIVTPKWKQLDDLQPLQSTMSEPADDEDVTESAVLGRHERSKELERLRFVAHISLGGSRHGGNARAVQKGVFPITAGTSSAGTNTPDNPMSPHVDVADLTSPMGTPPPTPQPLSEDSNHSTSSTKPPTSSSSRHNLLVPVTDSLDIVASGGTGSSCRGATTATDPSAEASPGTTKAVPCSRASHSSSIVISTPFLAGLQAFQATQATSHRQQPSPGATSTTSEGSTRPLDNTATSSSGRVGGSCAATVAIPGNRKLRSNSAGLRLRSSSSGAAAYSAAVEDDSGAQEHVFPYPEREFPLCESQFMNMLAENSEVNVYPVPVTRHPLLHSLDYDTVGEETSEEEDEGDVVRMEEPPTANHTYDHSSSSTAGPGPVAGDGLKNKRKLPESSCAAGGAPSQVPEAKKKNKRHTSPGLRHAAILTNHNVKATSAVPLDHNSTNNNRRLEDTFLKLNKHHLLQHHTDKIVTANKPGSVTFTLRENLNKSVGGVEGSEGRSSPLSEVTDSAGEDDITGDLSDAEGDSKRPPDWTISATADSSGHCVMQVMRN